MNAANTYRWPILLTIGFCLLVTLLFFAVGSSAQRKVNIATNDALPNISAPTVSFIDPSSGPAAAKVTIVEYADYACSACSQLAPSLKSLLQKYPNDVRLVWKDFPNESESQEATPAAIAARCADEQGQFWAFHDALFQQFTQLGKNTYQTIAQSLGLKADVFNTCVSTNEPLPRVRKDYDEGLALKLTATPTLYINGERQTGALSLSDLDSLVKAALAASK